MGTFLFFALFSGFLTALCCIPLLIPGVRSGMQANSGIRIFTVLSFSLIATLIGYSLINGMGAAFTAVVADPNYGMEFHTVGFQMDEVFEEIWWRLMIPWRPCYSSQQEICNIADQRLKNFGNPSITTRLSLLGLSIFVTFPSSIVLLLLSRPKKS